MCSIRLLTDYKQIINAIWQSVFSPYKFLNNPKSTFIIKKYGWIFCILRWMYYSFVFFLFRDYHGIWKPFSSVPFGMSIDTYAFLQTRFSLIFGIFLVFNIMFPRKQMRLIKQWRIIFSEIAYFLSYQIKTKGYLLLCKIQ